MGKGRRRKGSGLVRKGKEFRDPEICYIGGKNYNNSLAFLLFLNTQLDMTSSVWSELYMHVCLCCCCFSVAKSFRTLCDPMDCSPPGSSVHGISHIRMLEWVAISFSRGSSWPRDQTHVSYIGWWILYHGAMVFVYLNVSGEVALFTCN